MPPEQGPQTEELTRLIKPFSELSTAEKIELFQKIQRATGGDEELINIVLPKIGLDRNEYLILRGTRLEPERVVKEKKERSVKPAKPRRERAPREYIRRPLRKDRQKNPETEQELLLTLPETVRRRVAECLATLHVPKGKFVRMQDIDECKARIILEVAGLFSTHRIPLTILHRRTGLSTQKVNMLREKYGSVTPQEQAALDSLFSELPSKIPPPAAKRVFNDQVRRRVVALFRLMRKRRLHQTPFRRANHLSASVTNHWENWFATVPLEELVPDLFPGRKEDPVKSEVR